MIRFLHEDMTPPGEWNYVHPISKTAFRHHVIWTLRSFVQAHCKVNGYEFSETEFRENVAIHSPGATIANRDELGDWVAKLAQPIAKSIDAMSKAVGVRTNVAGCGGCKKRREKLNLISERMRG